ncbi:helix-turn-helix domain-containing protein [Limosilactobacillus caecicola]|uniref:helix-turn-helix domain-containing protein n=1 Tax=Limosilactobacillus caecicola TaxID=2941332 RepID=UPI0020415DC9|nr:helix-turn-helix domain-containing protein [Limosilactobacillus caecicola]
MDRYLLTMFSQHPRRFRVIENTVRNKRTQATLFWALNYQILPWLGSAPRMSRAQFDSWLDQQQRQGMLQIKDQLAWLTPAGVEQKTVVGRDYYQSHNNQWAWLTNYHWYAARFLLAVQAVSELAHHNRHYIPLNLSSSEMAKVRSWLTWPHLITDVEQELFQLGTQLAKQDLRLAEFFSHRLIGHQQLGWTSDEAQRHLQLNAEEIEILNRDVWLGVASQLRRQPMSKLGQLMNSLTVANPISQSAMRTVNDFQKGKTLKQIANMRHLKLSTVREHLLEAAIIIPQGLDWNRLLPENQEQVIRQAQPAPVTDWKFSPTNDRRAPEEFFWFRLCQIKELHQQNG